VLKNEKNRYNIILQLSFKPDHAFIMPGRVVILDTSLKKGGLIDPNTT